MCSVARRKGLYATVAHTDALTFLNQQAPAAADLLLAGLPPRLLSLLCLAIYLSVPLSTFSSVRPSVFLLCVCQVFPPLSLSLSRNQQFGVLNISLVFLSSICIVNVCIYICVRSLQEMCFHTTRGFLSRQNKQKLCSVSKRGIFV